MRKAGRVSVEPPRSQFTTGPLDLRDENHWLIRADRILEPAARHRHRSQPSQHFAYPLDGSDLAVFFDVNRQGLAEAFEPSPVIGRTECQELKVFMKITAWLAVKW
jgi:hypothetical protein